MLAPDPDRVLARETSLCQLYRQIIPPRYFLPKLGLSRLSPGDCCLILGIIHGR